MSQARFEAIFVPAANGNFAEWQVVEWLDLGNGERNKQVIERFGDCSGARAREEASLLQQAYNREFYEHFG